MLPGSFNVEICEHIYMVMGDCKISEKRDKPCRCLVVMESLRLVQLGSCVDREIIPFLVFTIYGKRHTLEGILLTMGDML